MRVVTQKLKKKASFTSTTKSSKNKNDKYPNNYNYFEIILNDIFLTAYPFFGMVPMGAMVRFTNVIVIYIYA